MYNEQNPVPNNLKFCYLKNFKQAKNTKTAKGIAKRGRFWPKGSFISVFFLNGSSRQIASMKSTIADITKDLELKIVYPTNQDLSDIRISFNYGYGSYSYVGTDCRFAPKDEETLNLGWWGKDAERHEFCHALNLSHEHQNPKGGIVWNKPAVLRDMQGDPNNWDVQTIEQNILTPLSLDSHIATNFDKDSIMLYPLPNIWTIGDFEVSGNTELSKGDRAFLKRNYVSTKRDTKSPVITLYGGVVVLEQGERFLDPGFKAVDNVDGDITNQVEIENNIDTSVLGIHSISYKATDKAGNSTRTIRNILVREKRNRKIEEQSPIEERKEGCLFSTTTFCVLMFLSIIIIALC